MLGTALGLIITRTSLWWRGTVDVLSFLSIGIPSVIVGLAVMILFLTLPIGIYGTVWILLIAYSYRLATTTRTARAGLMQIHTELEEASIASGARWLTTRRRIVLPLLAPAMAYAFVLLFIIGAREFTIPFGARKSRKHCALGVDLASLLDAWRCVCAYVVRIGRRSTTLRNLRPRSQGYPRYCSWGHCVRS